LQLDRLFGMLIGDSGTIAGNHRCTLPDRGRGVQRPWQHPPFDHQDTPCAAGRHRRDPAACARWHSIRGLIYF
jgi:hypothetical protein